MFFTSVEEKFLTKVSHKIHIISEIKEKLMLITFLFEHINISLTARFGVFHGWNIPPSQLYSQLPVLWPRDS